MADVSQVVLVDLREVLMEALAEMDRRDYLDPLERSYDALRVVVAHIEAGLNMESHRLTRPLHSLIGALSDTLRGGRPDLLQPRSRGEGRPKDQSFTLAQGAVAAALESLVRAGMQPYMAAKHVAAEAEALKIRDQKGQSLTPKQIMAWRARAGDDLSSAGTKVFRQLARQSPMSLDKAKEFVQDSLRHVASSGLVPDPIPEKA